jgi:DNA repair exonuclease SbcCD nuclease subunit/ABC-type transport system involved in cytochrome c biogenesis ATPase subunit
MRAIVTSDWQASWSNLDKCETALQELLAQCRINSVSLVVHAGDFKHHYSPVDVRVINFGVHFVKTLREKGIDVIILLGNHDRVSMSATSDNWFPALRAAGAITVDTPRYLKEFDIAAVPFMASADEAKKAFKSLAKKAMATTTLLFHNEISGCKLNVANRSKDDAIKLQDLHPNSYALCLGGHIHLHQKVKGNCYYIGSPFAQDWGEANQRKGNVLVIGAKVQFLETSIPGMYDPSLPGFNKASPVSWKGAKIRVHAAFDKTAATAYQPFINKVCTAASKRYPGADITVVPEFLEAKEARSVKVGSSDESMISSYVERTYTGGTSDKAKIATYLTTKLMKFGAWSLDSRTIKFLSVEAENFLCFARVKLAYKPGITVVTGVNKDWLGRNNGSGKTSLMQIPVAALTGETFKKQKAQALVRRNSDRKSKAFVSLRFRSADKALCEVIRSRRPRSLQFFVDGKDQSVGIGSVGTQEEIQRVSGLSLETIKNSMYIDQGAISAVLSGSDTERKNIFSKFLGLERYELARKECVEALSGLKRKVVEAEEDLRSIQTAIARTKETIQDFASEVSIRDLKANVLIASKQLTKAQDAVAKARTSKAAGSFAAMVAKEKALYQELLDISGTLRANSSLLKNNQATIERLTKYKEMQTCPVCKQKVNSQHLADEMAGLDKVALKLVAANKVLATRKETVTVRLHTLNEALEVSRTKAENYLREVVRLEALVRSANADLRAAQKRRKIKLKYLSRLEQSKKHLERMQRYLHTLHEEVASEQYCIKALSRDGVPAYIVSNIVPKLNAASKRYAKLFSENEIQVRFNSDSGDIEVEVLNLHGGETLKDQSAGETRIAGIITSFAVRDVINPSNLLVLDEPGESLDEINAKVFAEGLREASKELGCVLITTHNPFILGELRGERLIEVVKRNGVSTVNVQ